MYDNNPHSFDTRGLLWSLVILVSVVGSIGVSARYGTAIAAGFFERESQTAAAEGFALGEPEVVPSKQTVAEAKHNVPSRFIVNAKPPRLAARSFIVADLDSDAVFAQESGTTIYPIASITKLLTALVAKEVFAATTSVSVTELDRRLTFGSPGSILRDETFALMDAFNPLLTESNNSVANALAREYGTETFMDAMREKAASIGMTQTTLEDPSGISPQNAASALDIYLLTRHMYVHAPELLAMTRAKNTSVKAKSDRSYTFSNFNVFVGRDTFLGGKTGYTDMARQTMTTVFTVPVGSTTATVGIVVLGTDDRRRDTDALLTWFTENAQMASSTAP